MITQKEGVKTSLKVYVWHATDQTLDFFFKLINHLIIRNAALERISSYASWLVGIENL